MKIILTLVLFVAATFVSSFFSDNSIGFPLPIAASTQEDEVIQIFFLATIIDLALAFLVVHIAFKIKQGPR